MRKRAYVGAVVFGLLCAFAPASLGASPSTARVKISGADWYGLSWHGGPVASLFARTSRLAPEPSLASAAPPENVSPPTIVSDPPNTAIVSSTLADDGSTWTASLLSLSYQWEDCDANGNSCTAIPGATAQTYEVQPSDLGHTLRVVETGTNSDGSTTATSAPSVLVTEIPQNTTAPSISGDPAVGKTLTVSRGVWAPASEAISYSYQWVLCQGYCDVPISGATGSTYTVPASEAGASLAAEVTASINGGVFGSAVYSQPVRIAGAPQTGGSGPANTTRPSISGKPAVGSTLTAQPGKWSSGSSGGPVKFSYRWESCSSACKPIHGATKQAYTPTSAFLHKQIAVVVTATDTAGSSSAVSNSVRIGAVSQSAPSVRSQIQRLAASSEGKKAARVFANAVPAVAMSRAAQGLLARYAGNMTPFEKSLLKVDELIGAPQVQAALSALSSGHKPTAAQVKTVRRLFASLARNPAIKLLVQKGRALERSPKTLASYLAMAATAPRQLPASLPSTGDAALDRVTARIHTALNSASVAAIYPRARKLLLGAGAARYARTLPPLWAAALIPSQKLATDMSPSSRPRTVPVNQSLSATTNAWLLLGLQSTKWAIGGLVRNAIVDSATLGLLGDFAGAVAAVLGGPSAAAGLGFIGLFYAGQTAAAAIADVYYSYNPLGLKIYPNANVRMIAGQPLQFAVEGLGIGLNPIGPEYGATLRMVPNGGSCPGQVCTTTVAGPDGVTATMGGVTTSVPVTVLAGDLKTLDLSPSSSTVSVGTGVTFVAFGWDMWRNPVDVSTNTSFTIDPGSPNGWCTGATCGGNTPGTYTVKAMSGSVTQSATLIVTGAPARLGITSASGQWIAGTHHDFLVEELDANGNPIDSLGGSAVQLSETLDSTGQSDGPPCDTLGCTANSPGAHTIRASYTPPGSTMPLTGTLETNVIGQPDHLGLSPADASITLGSSEDYTVEEYDAGGNDLGTVVGATLSITPDGSCTGDTCTPAAAGPHTVKATVPNGNGGTVTGATSLTVAASDLAITTASLTSGELGSAYSATLQASGGTTPYTWSLATGSTLPAGLVLDSQSGAITGTPEQSGSFPVTIQLADSAGGTTSAPFTLDITAPPPVIYVANDGDDSVSAIDSTTNAVTATIPLQSGASPDGTSVTPDGAHAYVSDGGTGDVSVIDTSTNTVVATISVGGEPTGSAVTPDGKYVYVANATGNVAVIDTSTNTVVATVPIDLANGADPRAVTISPDGSLAYVADGYGDDVVVVSTASNTAVADIPINGFSTDVVLSPDGGTAYAAYFDVLNQNLTGVATIDTSADEVDSTYGFGRGVTGLTISPDGQTVYAAQTFGQVTALTASPMSVITNIPSSTSGSAIAITPDGNYLYTSGPGNNVTVISTATDAVVATIPVGTSPTALAMTP